MPIQPVNDAGGSLTVDGEVSTVQNDADGNQASSAGGHAPGVPEMMDLLQNVLQQLQIMNAHLAALTGDVIGIDEVTT